MISTVQRRTTRVHSAGLLLYWISTVTRCPVAGGDRGAGRAGTRCLSDNPCTATSQLMDMISVVGIHCTTSVTHSIPHEPRTGLLAYPISEYTPGLCLRQRAQPSSDKVDLVGVDLSGNSRLNPPFLRRWWSLCLPLTTSVPPVNVTFRQSSKPRHLGSEMRRARDLVEFPRRSAKRSVSTPKTVRRYARAAIAEELLTPMAKRGSELDAHTAIWPSVGRRAAPTPRGSPKISATVATAAANSPCAVSCTPGAPEPHRRLPPQPQRPSPASSPDGSIRPAVDRTESEQADLADTPSLPGVAHRPPIHERLRRDAAPTPRPAPRHLDHSRLRPVTSPSFKGSPPAAQGLRRRPKRTAEPTAISSAAASCSPPTCSTSTQGLAHRPYTVPCVD